MAGVAGRGARARLRLRKGLRPLANGDIMCPFMYRLCGLGGPCGPWPVMTLPRTTADVLSEHVVFEVESVDRMYLNVYQPKLQYGGGVSAFFVGHPGHKYASSVLMAA